MEWGENSFLKFKMFRQSAQTIYCRVCLSTSHNQLQKKREKKRKEKKREKNFFLSFKKRLKRKDFRMISQMIR
jgi:hypothetical protein